MTNSRTLPEVTTEVTVDPGLVQYQGTRTWMLTACQAAGGAQPGTLECRGPPFLPSSLPEPALLRGHPRMGPPEITRSG